MHKIKTQLGFECEREGIDHNPSWNSTVSHLAYEQWGLKV